jgi:hypothetical protein
MIQKNNGYLYNFISSSYLFDYDDAFYPILGLDSSLALYLFQYSKELFFSYPYAFTRFSIVADSYLFFNICCSLLEKTSSINNFKYTENIISYLFLDKFYTSIYNYNSDYYTDLYTNNEILSINYNGFLFHTLPIECIIAYCIEQYTLNNRSLQDATNIVLLCTVYYTQLMYNTLLSNLLLLKLNIKTSLKYLLKDIHKINMNQIPGFLFSQDMTKKRTTEVLEFCYG